MRKARSISLSVTVALVLAFTSLGIFFYRQSRRPIKIMGAVTVQDADFRKQLPITGVEITASNSLGDAASKSDSSGFFTLKLRKTLRKGEGVKLRFRHPDYLPLDIEETADDKLNVARLVPRAKDTPDRPTIAVANVRVRYSIKAMRTMNIGSAVKTLEVDNIGNVPCNGRAPCSPDGKWKAAIGSLSLDAGVGNEFRNARVSCIAGPCPFTKIESDDLSKDSQKITASARNWYSTAIFLVEAEVIHSIQSKMDHKSYHEIFSSALNFTLPTDAEGVSLEADMAGETIIFPLGPDLFLSWATCHARTNQDHTSVYRCELKPRYKFQ
jgi:hypothetical protein